MSLSEANNHLAINLYQLFAKENDNVFFSPFSISVAMGMLLCAADGQTAFELRTALGRKQAGIKNDEVTVIFERQMSSLLQPNDSYTLSSANVLLSRKNFQIKDAYKKILSETFKALILEVDFVKENKKVVTQINEWVKEKTYNMITKALDSLDPRKSHAFVLLNAIYFKGMWMNPFEREISSLEKFYNRGVEKYAKEIEMMHMEDSFRFYQEETFKILQLPYAGAEIAMLIFLPYERDGLDGLEAKLSPSFLQDVKKKFRMEEVMISLPRFRLEYTKSLVPYFSELGVKQVFIPGAEFTIASDSPELAVSEILHKAVLEVNEEGCEAAAATAVMVMDCAFQFKQEFVADHPFMFVLYNLTSDLILFMGRVYEL